MKPIIIDSQEQRQFYLDRMIPRERILEDIANEVDVICDAVNIKEFEVISILKGAVPFTKDLMEAFCKVNIDLPVDYIKASSYTGVFQSNIQLSQWEHLNVEGKKVLLVDDICDTGKTLKGLHNLLINRLGAKEVLSVVLLKRVGTLKDTFYKPDFSVYKLDTKQFVVGYGLDYKERCRGLDSIYSLEEGSYERGTKDQGCNVGIARGESDSPRRTGCHKD